MESPLLVKYEMVSTGLYEYVMASGRRIAMLKSISLISQFQGCEDTYPSAPQAALVGSYVPALRLTGK
jgi:hypothetical protein